jgi:hypothetical protein
MCRQKRLRWYENNKWEEGKEACKGKSNVWHIQEVELKQPEPTEEDMAFRVQAQVQAQGRLAC